MDHCPEGDDNDHESGFIATEAFDPGRLPAGAHLTISMNLSISHKRQQGYVDGLRRYDQPWDQDMVIHCGGDDAKITG